MQLLNTAMNCKPFLKWAGGKKALLSHLLKFIPKEYNNYFEPFLGSGTLFFALRPEKAYLSDLNEELINTYRQIKKNVGKVISALECMKYEEKFYYKIRARETKNSVFRASRFIYLNKTCWNGLYRVNSDGKFNVPIGRYDNPLICNTENLKAVSKVLRGTKIKVADFKNALDDVSKNDLIYLDPPYTTSHKNNGFIEYNNKIFKWSDQCRLAKVAKRLAKKGCYVLISNAYHPNIDNLYKDFYSTIVKRQSTLASDSKRRGIVEERIFSSFPILPKNL